MPIREREEHDDDAGGDARRGDWDPRAGVQVLYAAWQLSDGRRSVAGN